MAADLNVPPLLLGLAIASAFVGLWLLICWTLGKGSGWTTLQDRYPDRDDACFARLSMQSFSMGKTGRLRTRFKNCVTIEACSTGVRFRLWPLWGMFQRPFFVPWGDIAASEWKLMFLRSAKIRFSGWPDGDMIMPVARWNAIAAVAPEGGLNLAA